MNHYIVILVVVFFGATQKGLAGKICRGQKGRNIQQFEGACLHKVSGKKQTHQSSDHVGIIGIKRKMMIVKSQDPHNEGKEPTGQTQVDPTCRFGFSILGQDQFNADGSQPMEQSLQETNLSCQVLESSIYRYVYWNQREKRETCVRLSVNPAFYSFSLHTIVALEILTHDDDEEAVKPIDSPRLSWPYHVPTRRIPSWWKQRWKSLRAQNSKATRIAWSFWLAGPTRHPICGVRFLRGFRSRSPRQHRPPRRQEHQCWPSNPTPKWPNPNRRKTNSKVQSLWEQHHYHMELELEVKWTMENVFDETPCQVMVFG